MVKSHTGHDSNKIGLGTAIIIGLNAMIGAGIIAIPSLLATKTGPAGILTFVFSMIVVLLIGLSLGAVAHRYRGEGWNYLYPSKWGGHLLGMISSFSYLIGVVVAMGYLVQQAGIYAHQFIFGVKPLTLGVAVLIILTSLVLAGAQTSSFSQYLIICFVVAPLIVTSLVCWFHFDPKFLTPFFPFGPCSVFRAAPTALFGFLGFESIASLYAIVRNPDKNVPRACVASISIVGFFYLFFAASILFSVSPSFFGLGGQQSLARIIQLVFPAYPFLATLVSISALFAIIGTLHSMIWSLGVLLTGIMKRIKLPAIAHLVKRGIWNDRLSVLVIAMGMLIFALFMEGTLLVDMTAFFIVPSYIFSIAALLFIKAEWQSGRNIRTLLALAGGCIMVYYASQHVLEFIMQLFS